MNPHSRSIDRVADEVCVVNPEAHTALVDFGSSKVMRGVLLSVKGSRDGQWVVVTSCPLSGRPREKRRWCGCAGGGEYMRDKRQPGSGARAPTSCNSVVRVAPSVSSKPASSTWLAPGGNEGACSALAVVSTGLVRPVKCGTWGKMETWEPVAAREERVLGCLGINSDRLSIAPATAAQSWQSHADN